MNNQKDLEKELEGLSYLPKTVEPKVATQDVTLPAETPAQTTQLSLKQKIANVLTDFKKKGKALSPKLKKWATCALAGSLVAGMLFLNSCASMKSMQQIYPQEVVSMLEENGFSSKDYDAKKQEFLNANPADLDCGLQIVPYKYYRDRFGLTDQEISERVLGAEVFFVDGSLYLGAQYLPTFEQQGLVKEGEDWNKNSQLLSRINHTSGEIIGTLFKYDLEPELYKALMSAYSAQNIVTNNKSINKDEYATAYRIYAYPDSFDKKLIREDKLNNFAYRYLLNNILSSYDPQIISEGAYYHMSGIVDTNDERVKKDKGVILLSAYSLSGYPFIEDGYLYSHCFGIYADDQRGFEAKDKYLFRISIKLDEKDLQDVNYDPIKELPIKLDYIINQAIKQKRDYYVYPVGMCDKAPTIPDHNLSAGIQRRDFYEHGGRLESLTNYIDGLK